MGCRGVFWAGMPCSGAGLCVLRVADVCGMDAVVVGDGGATSGWLQKMLDLVESDDPEPSDDLPSAIKKAIAEFFGTGEAVRFKASAKLCAVFEMVERAKRFL